MITFSASKIRYEITRGNLGGAFAVKNMTGAIYVAGPLDYETRKRVSVILIIIGFQENKVARERRGEQRRKFCGRKEKKNDNLTNEMWGTHSTSCVW